MRGTARRRTPRGSLAAMRVLAAVLLCLAPALPAAAAGEEAPVRVTSGTPEYCGALAARFAAVRRAAPPDARALAAEGTRLCGRGHVRTGVAKLRRAIRLAAPEPE
ncbi:hypothetical protein [Caldovatus aquaticus]|uniref:Uncharacterized protein n=1 Tax=Caldovatus aquaticus TaxID=2865671 RepID=A0ABS7F5W7_9PROT|nr:hypothetical protein [Caldovatus aquaticus]MBW8271014.1 hypothetical protein [Caldovatus aquaticus]